MDNDISHHLLALFKSCIVCMFYVVHFSTYFLFLVFLPKSDVTFVAYIVHLCLVAALVHNCASFKRTLFDCMKGRALF